MFRFVHFYVILSLFDVIACMGIYHQKESLLFNRRNNSTLNNCTSQLHSSTWLRTVQYSVAQNLFFFVQSYCMRVTIHVRKTINGSCNTIIYFFGVEMWTAEFEQPCRLDISSQFQSLKCFQILKFLSKNMYLIWLFLDIKLAYPCCLFHQFCFRDLVLEFMF